jgi:hypothetical protein
MIWEGNQLCFNKRIDDLMVFFLGDLRLVESSIFVDYKKDERGGN